ncbi:hypothetical protein SUDANB6_02453 [Streptomyces sp. enrichment culture]|uniref:hypothetical protein n=1 Tax=Streptomyces sp. enrichment culture TaxID=1795815 RepID=UPI003F5724FE
MVKAPADCTLVHPLVRAHGDDDHVERTIVRRALTMTLSDPDRWDVTEGGLLPERYDVDIANSVCEVCDGYLHPAFPDGAAGGAPATGPAVDPYDRSRPLTGEREEGGGRVTRT